MAGDDTAALVVALSAQVTKFEKDMKQASDIADKRTKEIENSFARLNKTVTDKLSGISQSLVSNLGFAGQALTSLGPAGFAAAAGLGAAYAAFNFLSDATEKYAEKAKALKESSEVLGLTITQLKVLGGVGRSVGVDFDSTTAFFTKFLISMDALKNGSGPLRDALLKIDRSLVDELVTTTDSAAAIDVLVKAYSRLTEATQKVALAKAAGGKGGTDTLRTLEALSKAGGLSGAVAKAGPGDDAQTERIAKLSRDIAAIKKDTDNIYGKMFAEEVLEQQKRSAEFWKSIAESVQSIKKYAPGIGEVVSGPGIGGAIAGAAGAVPVLGSIVSSARWAAIQLEKEMQKRDKSTEGPTVADRFRGLPDFAPKRVEMEMPSGAPPPTEKPKRTAAAELADFKIDLSVLGEATTAGEAYKLKLLELKAAQEQTGVSQTAVNRAITDFNAVQKIAQIAVRERLGIASEMEMQQARLIQLERDRIKYGLSANDVLQATVLIMREAKAAAEALEVRRAYLPGLKQLELDAKNLQKTLDHFAVSSLNTMTDELANAVMGTKTLSQAFSDMAKSILNDIAKMVIRAQVTGPLASMLGGLFGGGGAAGAASGTMQVGNQIFPKFAGGTNSAPGGMAIVGESGPELVNLPRGSQVISNDALRSGGGAMGGQIVYAPAIDARGASVEAVARLAQIMEQDRASFATRTVQTIQQARKGRIPGL